MTTQPSTQPRSLRLDLIPPESQRRAIVDSIRRYRAVCRQCYSVLLLSQAAGANVEEHENGLRLQPDNDRAKEILGLAMGKTGKALAYELRDYVLRDQWPTALSFVWDSIRRDVASVWTSGDPEYPKASRGYLALQGARGVAQFQRRGIGLPRATARPKLDGHTLSLKWDHSIGTVCFDVPRLDSGRYHVWRNLRDRTEGWGIGTIYLTERDGLIFSTVTYSLPAVSLPLDAERKARVSFGADQENFIKITSPDGAATFDSISAVAALELLNRDLARRQDFERRRAACGSPRQPWGNRQAYGPNTQRLERLSALRQRHVQNWNHAWTRRIVSRAAQWRCGSIQMKSFPDDLFGFPWNWTGFSQNLEYKAQFAGIAIERGDDES